MSAVIWNGDNIKALLPALKLGNFAVIRSGTDNPQTTATAGIRGDVYIRTGVNAAIYQKVTTDATDTNWALIPEALTALAGSSVIVTDTLGNLKTDAGITYDSTTDTLAVAGIIYTPSLQRATSGTLAIGTDGNATTINIGTTGSTINLQGTTVYQNVTNANVANKQIHLNVGGGIATATLSGVEIEENGITTAYIHTSADRNSWQLLAPNTAGIITFTPGAGGFTINQGSHDPVTLTAVGASPNANGASLSTQALTLQPADGTNPGLLTAIAQTIGGNKTFTGTITASNFTGSVSGTNTGDVTLAAFGTVPNASAASLSGQVLTLQPADATNPGGVSTATQSFGGFKTFIDHVVIGGSTDNVQLLVKEFSGQTVSGLLEVQNFTGTNLFQVNRLGKTTVTGNLEVAGTGSGTISVLIKGSAGASVASFAVVDNALAQLFEVGSPGTIGGLYVAQVHGAFNVTGNITGANLSGTNSGNVSLAAVGATPNANAATLVGQVLNLEPADASFPGVVTTGTQTFAGTKTFTSTISANISGTAANVTGTVAIANGGTGQTTANAGFNALSPMTTLGDTIYGGVAGVGTRLPIGTAGQVLTVTGGIPAWTTSSSGTVTSVSVVTANGFAGTVATATTTPAITISTTITGILQGDGTAISAASTTGTGAVVLANSPTLITPNLGTPSVLIGTNITNIPLTTAVTGILPVPNGGTGRNTLTNHGVLVGAGTSDITQLAVGASGTLLQGVSGSDPQFTATPTLGVAGTTTGTLSFAGQTSGTITVQPQSIAGTYNFNLPTTAGTTGQPLLSGGGAGAAMTFGTLAIANGGTSVTSVTTTPTAGAFAGWDANRNLSADSFIAGYTTTVTAAGTTTLTVDSMQQQYFTGTTTQTLALPVTSTLVLGQSYFVTNNSTGTVTVQSSGGNTVLAMAAGTSAIYTVILTSGTTAASWSTTYVGNGGAVMPTVSKATTAGTATGTGGFVSGTYTTPANVIYLRVRMVGGGGQGGPSGSAGGSAGGSGTASTFGTSLLTANGGNGGGALSTANGATGGTASITSPAVGTALTGGAGGGGFDNRTAATQTGAPGGTGGNSAFGGGGASGYGSSGTVGAANTGGGGPGGGTVLNAGSVWVGAGGGAGGFVDAIIPNPSATYSYNVGSAGTGGTGGTSGFAGGDGAVGYIEVTEYYSNGAVGTATNVTGIVAVANGGTGSTTGPILAVTSKTANYTAITSDDVILCDSSGGAFTITLYTAVGNSGKTLKIAQIGTGTNAVTVDGNSSETINGSLTWTVSGQYSWIEIVSNGSNWFIMDSYWNDVREAVLTSNTTTTTADTWIDVTGASTGSLPIGIWDIIYDGSAYAYSVGTGGVAADVEITDSANTLINNAITLFSTATVSAGNTINFPIHLKTRVTVTTATTYKLRLRCTVATASGEASIFADNWTGALTNPDMKQRFTAIRTG